MESSGKKGAQVTVFIILAILIVVGVLLYFAFRGGVSSEVPEELLPAYNAYLSCIEDNALSGVHLLGEQAGYIEVPDFEAGSAYSPFSNQLDFMGQPVPYWMYISGNNFLKEQVPTMSEMEGELEDYVSERVDYCDFSILEEQGYDIYVGEESSVDAQINDNNVQLSVQNDVTIFYGGSSIVVRNHQIDLSSKLGKFYDMAIEVYNYEKSEMFLEKYALDVMRLYAPVSGTEITCTPMIFVDSEIQQDLKTGFSANVASLKLQGSYYGLGESSDDYFVTDVGIDIDENVNFMYMEDWPTRIEIYGDKVVTPVGIQEGLGILGFCYVPYQLVYDIYFPVLIQFYDDNEIFQFPIGVVIDNNQAREAIPTESGISTEDTVCLYPNKNISIYTYDEVFNPVPARITFQCLDSSCSIGETELIGSEAYLEAGVPTCVNGYLIASADGYSETKVQISTNDEDYAEIYLPKKVNMSLDLGDVDSALVSFTSEDYSTTVLYPGMDSVELIEAYYNVSVYVYDNSSLKFPEINKRECVDVPETGLAGFFGAETEKCYDINIPEMEIDFAVVGGGLTQEYITLDLLENSDELNINVPLFGTPSSLEQMQENTMMVEDSTIYLEFE